MATDLMKAASDARLLLKGFKAFADVAAALEAAGQLDQRVAEAQRALADLQPQIEAAKGEAQAAKDEAASTAEAAAAKAAAIVAEAEAAAKKLTEQAWAEHGRVTALGQTQKAKYADAVAALTAQYDDLAAKRDALLAEADSLEARISKARAQAAKLLA